ncbi:MAG TPA: hypothetical protein VIH99_08250 [Bdellovibrionota bacterium]|jgi:pilus assembly protein CpaC
MRTILFLLCLTLVSERLAQGESKTAASTGTFSEAFDLAKRELGGINGITVREQGVSYVVISGKLKSAETVLSDYDLVLKVQNAYPRYILNLVTLGESIYTDSAERMQREIRKLDGSEKVSVRVLNGTFFMEGEVNEIADRDYAETIATTFLPPIMGSNAIRENVLMLGAKKFSVRNMIRVKNLPRMPASR